jgi:hypothetical protein
MVCSDVVYYCMSEKRHACGTSSYCEVITFWLVLDNEKYRVPHTKEKTSDVYSVALLLLVCMHAKKVA